MVPPYPDLLPGSGGVVDAGAGARAGYGSGTSSDRAGQTASRRHEPVIRTLAGRNRQQLDFRLVYMINDFRRYSAARPWQPARLDPRSPRAAWVIDALIAAIRARIADADGGGSLAEFTNAVRHAEDRWQQVRSDVRRGAAMSVDLRPSPLVEAHLTTRTAHQPVKRYNDAYPGRDPLVATTRGGPASGPMNAQPNGKTQPGRIVAQRVAEASYRPPSHRA